MSILEIGLDRKRGLQGGFRSPSPREQQDMVPDVLPPPPALSHTLRRSSSPPSKNNNTTNTSSGSMPGQHYFTVPSLSNTNNNNNSQQQHWENSTHGIETHKRRSPIMTSAKKSVVIQHQHQNQHQEDNSIGDHNLHNDTKNEELVDPTGGDISFTIMLSNHDETSNNNKPQQNGINNNKNRPSSVLGGKTTTGMIVVDSTPTKQLLSATTVNNNSNNNNTNPSPNSGANTPSWVKKQLQELQNSPLFSTNNNNSNNLNHHHHHHHQGLGNYNNKAIGIGIGNQKKRRNSASIGTVNRQTVQIIPGPSNANNNSNVFSPSPLEFTINNNNNSTSSNNNSFVKLSPVHFSAASHFGTKKGGTGTSVLGGGGGGKPLGGSNLSMMNISASTTPANTPNGINNSNSNLYSSPVAHTASDPVNFYFITKQRDPIKEQLRRADAVIAALPSKDATPLPPVVDTTGNPMSSASVLDGLISRTTLLQLEHDRTVQNQKQLQQLQQIQQQQQQQNQNQKTNTSSSTASAFASTTTTTTTNNNTNNTLSDQQQKNKDRTANAIMGIHISALLDLSRSLALTDPNASQVVRRVHEVLTSHVVKSVEEPLERVSSLYDQARRHAEQAWDESASLKSQLLDAHAEIQSLKRQVRKRDDMLAYLTSAYSLPTVFKDTATDNPELISQALLVEASPSAALAKKNAETRNRRGSADGGGLLGGERRRSLSGDRGGGGGATTMMMSRRGGSSPSSRNGEEEMNSWYDPNKSLQEQFQVIIPSQQEKDKILNTKNKTGGNV